MPDRVTVSYENEEELQGFIKLIELKIHHVKRHKNNTGKYKKADIWLKH